MKQITKEIPLTRGKVALVNSHDYRWLSKRKWQFIPDERGGVAVSTHLTTSYRLTSGSHKKTIVMHRAIMARILGRKLAQADQVEHTDGNHLNNCRRNLHLTTKEERSERQQIAAIVAIQKRKTSYQGVRWDKIAQNFQASFRSEHGRQLVGNYATDIEAAKAWDKAVLEFCGPQPWLDLNFSPDD